MPTDKTKLTVALRNFANTSKNCYRPVILMLVVMMLILKISLN